MLEAEESSASDSEDVKKMLKDNDKLVEEIFQQEDTDKNGFISHNEFSGPKHDELWAGNRDHLVFQPRARLNPRWTCVHPIKSFLLEKRKRNNKEIKKKKFNKKAM